MAVNRLERIEKEIQKTKTKITEFQTPATAPFLDEKEETDHEEADEM